MPRISHIAPLICAIILTGCNMQLPEIMRKNGNTAPPEAAPGTCWAKSIKPAEIETVETKVLDKPAITDTDGTELAPATYRTTVTHNIVSKRTETWFEASCDPVFTTEFITNLQRALRARQVYDGAETGILDDQTRAAIRLFQIRLRIYSDVLSLKAMQDLGLVATIPAT